MEVPRLDEQMNEKIQKNKAGATDGSTRRLDERAETADRK